MMNKQRFEKKVVIITGGTSGIGKACALAFANEGATVIIVGRNEDHAINVCNIINGEGIGKAEYFICDVSDEKSVINLKQKIRSSYDHVDVLFNNAGIFLTSGLEEMDSKEWHRSFAVNVDGTMYMTQCFMDMLSIGSDGCIINNASVSGLDYYTNGNKNYMYGASKAALVKFSKLCALNYAGKVRVNVICPGIIDTEIYTNRDFSRFIPSIPMGYVAETDAVTGIVLFLASNEASYITGAVIPVDGGMSLK